MSSSRSEKLSEYLLNVDEDILEKAYSIDSAEKLRMYKARQKRSRFTKIAVMAAVIALLVAAVLAVPALLEQGFDPIFNDNNEEALPPPWVYDENETVTINSIDSLNYYSAMLILSKTKTPKNLSTDKFEAMPVANNFEFVSDDIYYYELDPNEIFTVTKVIFFKINVNDKNSFLASKVGMGVVDVVITENSLDNMITFKNGNRFYSCLENGWSPQRRDFSTHKYIEGFCIVKNLEQENFSFYVETNSKESVLGFDSVSDGGSIKYTNSEHEVLGSTYVRKSTSTFTVSDLQKYFKNEDIEKPVETADFICSNGFYNFEFYGDNTFMYKSVDESSALYKNGNYEFEGGRVILSFKIGDEVVETVKCEPLENENGFLYDGEKYIAVEPAGGDNS